MRHEIPFDNGGQIQSKTHTRPHTYTRKSLQIAAAPLTMQKHNKSI